MKLAISLATRGRAAKLIDTINRSIVHWTNPDTVLHVMADSDDHETISGIRAIAKDRWGDKVWISVEPRDATIAAKWNRIVKLEPDADVYMPAADDDPYITPGYDQKLLDAAAVFPDGIGMVFGHMANASFTGVMAFPRKTLELMGGKMYMEIFPYWFVDHWADDVARMIGRISFADVRTDQSAVGKTQELREPAWWATFFDSLYLVRRRQANAIINHPDFQSPPWMKEMLLKHHPLIEYRSRWVNDNVRANARNLEGWSGLATQDERYVRIKEKAKEIATLALVDPEITEADKKFFTQTLFPPTAIPSLKRAFA